MFVLIDFNYLTERLNQFMNTSLSPVHIKIGIGDCPFILLCLY